MQSLSATINQFFIPRYLNSNLWFKRLVYGFLLYKCLHWNYYFDFLFGENAVLYPNYTGIGWFKDLAFVLLKHPSDALSRVFIFTCFFISAYLLFFKSHVWLLSFFLDLLLWYIVLNLQNKMYTGLSGGNSLFNQLLLFNCFINTRSPEGVGHLPELRLFLQNLAILFLQVQVMVVYFISAVSKLGAAAWLDGSAIQQILQIEHFSAVHLPGRNIFFSFFIVLTSYAVLVFQLIFPFVVWWERGKRYFLLFGIVMHLYIAFFMGLPDFAFVMLLGYWYFWPRRQSTVAQ